MSFQEQNSPILGAGLNWIRVPLAFWAIETWAGEPYLEGTSWKSAFYPTSLCELQLIHRCCRYFVRFLGWARKYGMRVCLDLHAVPGSQNGQSNDLAPLLVQSLTAFYSNDRLQPQRSVSDHLRLPSLPFNDHRPSRSLGVHNFLQGIMGLANAQRTLYYLRIITEFISQPQYRDVVPMFGIINEPTLTMDILTPFYLQAYNIIRNITGVGAGNGPVS